MTFVSMVDGSDWIMRPVLKGMCGYESLIDGTIGLRDIARLNDCLDVSEENERLVAEYRNHKR